MSLGELRRGTVESLPDNAQAGHRVAGLKTHDAHGLG